MNATVFDISDWTAIEISGPDARSFLHNFCTNNINALKDNHACEALLLNVKGRILGHVFVLARQESLLLFGTPGQSEFLTGHLKKYHLIEDLSIDDRTGSQAVTFLTGADTATVLNAAIHELNSIDLWSVHGFSSPGAGTASRLDLFGEPGVVLFTAAESGSEFRLSLVSTGAQERDTMHLHALRIASGFPWYGVDLSEENLAQEAARTSNAISFNKGCYLGQEPVARLHAMGHVNRQLRCVKIEAADVPERGAPVFAPDKPDKPIGTLTSTGWSETIGGPIGLGMLRVNVASVGSRVIVGSDPGHDGTVFWNGADS